MASVSGGNFDGTSSKVAPSLAGSLKTGSSAAIGQHLALASSGQQSSLAAGGAAPSSIDTSVGVAREAVTFAGKSAGSSATIQATQTTHQGGVTLSFQDGTSLTVIGANHLGHFFGQ